MSIHWSYIIVALVAFLLGAAAAYRLGRYVGQQALIRMLFEAKDQELWLAGHYVSVDIKEQTRQTRKTTRPRDAK